MKHLILDCGGVIVYPRRGDWNIPFRAAEIDALADDFTDNIDRYGFFDGVNDWLSRWKRDYSLAMLSDAMPSILEFTRQAGVYDLLDAAVISTQIGAIKPDPRMYSAIVDALLRDGDIWNQEIAP